MSWFDYNVVNFTCSFWSVYPVLSWLGHRAEIVLRWKGDLRYSDFVERNGGKDIFSLILTREYKLPLFIPFL